jgi:hypothetical protein
MIVRSPVLGGSLCDCSGHWLSSVVILRRLVEQERNRVLEPLAELYGCPKL